MSRHRTPRPRATPGRYEVSALGHSGPPSRPLLRDTKAAAERAARVLWNEHHGRCLVMVHEAFGNRVLSIPPGEVEWTDGLLCHDPYRKTSVHEIRSRRKRS